ncbi:hypothetical protein QCA50_003296 [Cerrena zonata]|uniref:Secreted protein n=1 Tax=Cerrena zonata TaxID=2478898 RepID=A0AAW0GRP4_9APHY
MCVLGSLLTIFSCGGYHMTAEPKKCGELLQYETENAAWKPGQPMPKPPSSCDVIMGRYVTTRHADRLCTLGCKMNGRYHTVY